MNTLYNNSSLYAIVAAAPSDTSGGTGEPSAPPRVAPGNGEDTAPPEAVKATMKARRARKAEINEETIETPPKPEKPLPNEPSPPPPQPETSQPGATKARLDFSKSRVRGLQPTQTQAQATRIPVIMRPEPSKYWCTHPTYGGFASPHYVWRHRGSDKGVSDNLRLADDRMAGLIEENGGDVFVAGLYWCRYHKGGDFILAVNLESDNPYTSTTRDIVEQGRTEWVKRINKGGYYESKPPNVPIAPTVWEAKEYEDVLSLGFQEIIDSEDHPDYVELIHSRADTPGEQGLSAMGERMAKVERRATGMGGKVES
jgi:hypothetical protein